MDDETADLMYQQAQQLEKMLDGFTAVFGDPVWFSGVDVSGEVYWNLMEAVAESVDESGELAQIISDSERQNLLALQLPAHMTEGDVNDFCDRWNRSINYWAEGKYTHDDLSQGDNADFIDAGELQYKSLEASLVAQDTLDQGFENMFDGAHYAQQEFLTSVNQGGQGVCAKVKMKVKQDAVMTRTAFNAVLELENESSIKIDNALVEINITDESGANATDLFGIYPPALSGISAIDGTDSLLPGEHARAEWIILPTNEAAPDTEKVFYVGATFTYYIDGLEVVVPIHSDMITVKPEAQLDIKYFHQKNVYSDDPFTDDVEAAEPFSLGMMVTNTGAGPARNVQMTSAQPQIIRHEQDKDILVDFEIVDAELNGNNLLDSFTVNMGDIEPGSMSIARWKMISSLQGEFVSYDASFEHINGLGDSRLSLIQNVEVHELIHGVRSKHPSDDGIVDFLVNGLADSDALPDTLYTSAGTVESVDVITDGQTDGLATEADLQVELSCSVPVGNVYIRIDDPSEEGLKLAYVQRSDGKLIMPEYNCWTTDRMIRPMDQPDYRERFLHIFDTNSTGFYTLVYTTIQNPLNVVDITLQSDPVSTVDITFDVPVDASTFDWTDIELTRNYGENLLEFPITIRQISDRRFRISGLAYLTLSEGRYELRVNTENILSEDAVPGVSISSTTWLRTFKPWDVDSDKKVNFADFSEIAQKWMFNDCEAPTWCGNADVNRDGNVTFEDVVLLCDYWLAVIE